MRYLLAILALMVLAVPAYAEEDEALVLDIGTNWAGGRSIEQHSGLIDGTIRAGIVGDFLWLEWGSSDRAYDSSSENIVSVDVSDASITQVVAHRDGTVDVVRQQPGSAPGAEPDPDPVQSIDVTEDFSQIDWPRLIPAGVRLE